MSLGPNLGVLHTLAGSAIATAYGVGTVSGAKYLGLCSRIRFYVRIVTAGASNLTTVTVKLKHRYITPANTALGYIDLPSDKGDASKTFEVEHAYTVSAAGTFDFAFYLDNPRGIPDLAIDVKANAAGITDDLVTIYGMGM